MSCFGCGSEGDVNVVFVEDFVRSVSYSADLMKKVAVDELLELIEPA